MSSSSPRTPSGLVSRLVLGGYSVAPEGDDPETGTGLRVLDLDAARPTGDPYGLVGHEALPSPTWVVAHPRQPWLVSVGETAPSEVVCTALGEDGRLTVLSRCTTGGDFGCHLALSADGRQVLVAHYGSGSVETFALDAYGQLTGPLGRYRSDAPLGPDPDRQDGPHAHQVALDPERDEALVCDLGTDRVHRLRLAPDGTLTEAAPDLVLPPGAGPRHLVLASDLLVVACELSVELWVARRDGDGWRHTQTVPTTAAGPEERSRSAHPVLPSAVQAAGERVVVATRGVDTVAVLDVDRETGTLRPVVEVPCGGQHPRDLVVGDGLVWVANQWSDEVVVLDLADLVAGREPAPVARIGTPRPACVVLTGEPAR